MKENSKSVKIMQKNYDKNYYLNENTGKNKIDKERLFALNLLDKEGRNRKALDIGCGGGLYSLEMRKLNYNVLGIDISEAAISLSKTKGIQTKLVNIEEGLPFKDHRFDIIWMSEVLEHIFNFENLLGDIYRVLKYNGKLIMTIPNSNYLPFYVKRVFGKTDTEIQNITHLRFFNYPMILRYLKKTGFNKIRIYPSKKIRFFSRSFVILAEKQK